MKLYMPYYKKPILSTKDNVKKISFMELVKLAQLEMKVTSFNFPNIVLFNNKDKWCFFKSYDYTNNKITYFFNQSYFLNQKNQNQYLKMLELLSFSAFDYYANETLELNGIINNRNNSDYNRNLNLNNIEQLSIKGKKMKIKNIENIENEDKTWQVILDNIVQLSNNYPNVVFIGGVAVYIHLLGKDALNLLETSHDIDLYMSMIDFQDLTTYHSNEYEISHNPRLQKHQFKKDNIEMDIYKEYQNNLKIPYNELFENSVIIDNVRIASLEHLMILKLEAYKDRLNSSKGDKDKRDIIKIIFAMSEPNNSILESYLTQEDIDLIEQIVTNPKNYIDFIPNRHYAKQIAKETIENFKEINKIEFFDFSPSM